MTKLTWGEVGSRRFEAGVDRGVIYPKRGPSAAWSGLVAVTERPAGGAPTAFYYDGFKYLNISGKEEFAGTIEAYYSPPEFDKCEGVVESAFGMSVTGQPRVPFDFSYRTRIGNDLQSTQFGYKLHLVYNALVSPTDHGHKTMAKQSDPNNLSWGFTTSPIKMEGLAPSAHLVLDSTRSNGFVISEIEKILYGTADESARMPTPVELLVLYQEHSELTITDNGDGTWTALGPDGVVMMLDDVTFMIDWPSVTWIDSNTYNLQSS